MFASSSSIAAGAKATSSFSAPPCPSISVTDGPCQATAYRQHFLSVGRFKPTPRFKFPTTKDRKTKRTCQFSWFQKHEFIEYSKEKDALFCFDCCIIGKRNPWVHGEGSEDDIHSWKNITQKIDCHVALAAHKAVVSGVVHLRKQQANQAKPIDEQITDIKEMERGKRVKERLLNCEGLKMILSVILWLARQGLLLRGHREQDDSPSNNRGNFLELLQFKLKDNLEKKRWFDSLPENSTYLSPPMKNMFIQIIADQVRAAVLQELNDGDLDRVFAICADESTDSTKCEQMSLYIRFVNKKGDLVERCLALIEVPSTKAADLLEAIHASMKTSQFDKSRVIAQCYDGALNMLGEFNGLQQLIREMDHPMPSTSTVMCIA